MSDDLKSGIRSSKGNPWVLFALNVLLSATFAYIVLYLTEFVGLTTFSLNQFLAFTIILVVVTYVVALE